MTKSNKRSSNAHLLTTTDMTSSTSSSSSQTFTDPTPHLAQHDPLYACSRLFNGTALPDPAHLRPSFAKGRTRADRHLLSELGRVKTTSMRHSSHKAMAKRMFFLFSGHRRMRDFVAPSCEIIRQLDERSPPLLSQYPLPSFRDGFTVLVQDTGDMGPTPPALLVNGGPGCWLENAVACSPSVSTSLGSEW